MTHTNYKVIPFGIDFDLFRPISTKHPEVLSNSILYIGSILNYPKGFDRVLKIVNNMPEQNFCFIMKDDFKIDHHRIKVFNKIDSNTVVSIINSCICAICTSRDETQHLSGIECGACDIPIVATSVGMYDDIKDSQEWGLIADDTNFVDKINYVIQNRTQFKPRSFFEKQYTYEISKNNWIELIDSI
jgi:glycosyltransferase involved in cell wall biosynthesis